MKYLAILTHGENQRRAHGKWDGEAVQHVLDTYEIIRKAPPSEVHLRVYQVIGGHHHLSYSSTLSKYFEDIC